MDDATARFQTALPYALLPISPSLAALHFVRVKSSFNSCHQCGCALHRGESSVRTVRSKRPNSRTIQTTCLICGWVHKEPLVDGNASLFPRTKKQGVATIPTVVNEPKKSPPMHKVEEAPKHFVVPREGPSAQQAAPPSSTPPLPKPRPKNKGGLHSMLERNRRESQGNRQSERETRSAEASLCF
ncbi:hypothetical protein B0H12DRAFT_23876 [Mycena haematopus]|nr:hypothetical protein B0H12DRAFT_23876 [Mycena haematopus]